MKMSDLKNIFDIAGRGMSAQMLRLNTVASNLANARSVASTEEEAYRAIKPVFSTLYADDLEKSGVASVDVVDIVAVDRQRLEHLRDTGLSQGVHGLHNLPLAAAQIEWGRFAHYTSLVLVNA